jgi:hypothetical protein
MTYNVIADRPSEFPDMPNRARLIFPREIVDAAPKKLKPILVERDRLRAEAATAIANLRELSSADSLAYARLQDERELANAARNKQPLPESSHVADLESHISTLRREAEGLVLALSETQAEFETAMRELADEWRANVLKSRSAAYDSLVNALGAVKQALNEIAAIDGRAVWVSSYGAFVRGETYETGLGFSRATEPNSPPGRVNRSIDGADPLRELDLIANVFAEAPLPPKPYVPEVEPDLYDPNVTNPAVLQYLGFWDRIEKSTP